MVRASLTSAIQRMIDKGLVHAPELRKHPQRARFDPIWPAPIGCRLLGWPDTFDAEYVAPTQLHADGLITLDQQLAHAMKDLVTVAPIEALYRPKRALRVALPREHTDLPRFGRS